MLLLVAVHSHSIKKKDVPSQGLKKQQDIPSTDDMDTHIARKTNHTLSERGRQENMEDGLQEIKMTLTGGLLEHYIYIYLFTAIGLLPGGSGYFTCKQIMKLVTTEFKSGGLHEKPAVTAWNLRNHLSICL